MRRAAPESAAAPVSHYAAGPVELDDVCRTKLKLPYQTDSDAALLPNLIHQLGSAHEWSGVWIRPYLLVQTRIWPQVFRLANKAQLILKLSFFVSTLVFPRKCNNGMQNFTLS